MRRLLRWRSRRWATLSAARRVGAIGIVSAVAAMASSSGGVMPAVDGVTPELLPDKDRVYCMHALALGRTQTHVRKHVYR